MAKFGFGYLRSFSMGAITAGNRERVAIDEDDQFRVGYFNVVDVFNNSDEDLELWLDGNSDKKLNILSKTSKSLNGTRFRELVLNNSDSTDTSAGEVIITIQKEYGRQEEAEGVKL